MSPHHFLRHLTFYEAQLFLEGLRVRQRQAWEVARYSSFYSAAPHCKDFDFSRMGKFPWEKETVEGEDKTDAAAELAELRELARQRDEEFLKQQEDGRRDASEIVAK